MLRRLGLLALLAIAALGTGAAWLDSQISRPFHGYRPDKVFVEIPHGASRWRISGILARDRVIRSRLAFELLSLWHIRRPLQAGEYLVDGPMNSRQVFWMISKGRIFVHVVTVPEGWSMYDIAAELDRQGVCSREDFLKAAKDTSLISDLAPHALNDEGFLFPSTYEFKRRATCSQIVATMVTQFRDVWSAIDSPPLPALPQNLTLEQMVALASLVERETPNPQERPLIAGVFYNRLAKGYPLQCDPTVQYALERQGRLVKALSAADLRIDSPYSTYEHRGLPPGPIANPGAASLRAALDPSKTDFLYFVANDRGGHFFSKSLAEHNRNVARYRRLLEDSPATDSAVRTPK